MDNSHLLLGIETSCDETAAAIVGRNVSGRARIMSNVVLSQIEAHEEFGGVVPEIAARTHLSALGPVVEKALKDARITIGDLKAIAVTGGPGLTGGLLVGLMMAKGLSRASGLPLVCINHLEGHALTARLTDNLLFPYLLLLVSGGHTQIVSVKGLGDYERWASSIDDALGETFDKTAKLLSLGFPGGPMVEKAALQGDKNRFDFPQPMKGRNTLNMSFSGLKTAVRITARELAPLREQDVTDICASFQKAVAATLVDRLGRAMDLYENGRNQSKRDLVIAGGVAANLYLRQEIESLCKKRAWNLIAPPLEFCGDNGAMIAWAGLERFEAGFVSPLSFAPRSRWPLDEVSENLVGGGKRGAKV